MRVSFIIPTFNHAAGSAVSSCLNMRQGYKVVIIDDCSTDVSASTLIF